VSVPAELGLSKDLPSRFVRIAAAWFLFLGIMGLLLVGASGGARSLFGMVVDPVSSGLHLAIGLVGVAMSTTPRRARWFTIVLGPALIIWGVLALATDGSLGTWASADPQVVGMHLLIGVAAIVVTWAPSLGRIDPRG
jgi:hypothetical protein